ncbi:MAG TPA: dihydrolipoamide acetyltransferase family protein [Burkholderiales bacterium]|nr:dihydrolipoamide acetyltransferase family protein [Burkholderiales bacterium]
MPALEMAQETGKILAWLKKEGDAISKGEPLLEVETDKAIVEIEATADGVLAGVKSHEGDVVPVGVTIAWILAPGEQPPAESPTAAPSARKITEQPQPAAASPTPAPAETAAPAEGGARISPKARRLAKERGVDINRIRGTGADGTITSEDVLAAAEAPPVAAAPAQASAALSAIARLMAERTTQSWTQVPHFFLVREIDAGALVQTREQLGPAIERDRGVKVTHTDLLVALTARVLKKHPKLNASWAGNAIQLNPQVNMSVAMAVTDGVVGAVIPNADLAALADIALQRRDLTERARSGRLRPADLAAGTFTITNLGMYSVDAFNAIIAPPQAASLAVGRIADRVVAVNGQPGVRPMMTLTLSGDHRVVDGAQAAVFLNDLAEAIRVPGEWLG